jgi:tRNA nucleotidyltransferase/poly(A) polymerase
MEMKNLLIIKSQKGILKLKELGGEIFLVGGCVRDFYYFE